MDQIRVPQRDVARLEHQVDLARPGRSRRLPARRPAAPGRALRWSCRDRPALRMAARNEAHPAGVRIVRIDREPGLDVGAAEVAIRLGRAAEARILVPREIAAAVRQLPVELVDDLLEVAADQRLQDRGKARVGARLVEHVLVIGRPLRHRHVRRAAVALRRRCRTDCRGESCGRARRLRHRPGPSPRRSGRPRRGRTRRARWHSPCRDTR